MKIKTIIIGILLVLMIALVGCSQGIKCEAPSKVIGNKCCVDANDNGVCDTDDPKPVPAERDEPVVDTPPEPTPQPEVQVEPEVASEPESNYQNYVDSLGATDRKRLSTVRKLMETALDTKENYFYRYTTPTDLQTEYWVLGDKMKVQPVEASLLDKYTTYNMVYIDRSTGKAEGYCEPDGAAKCWEGHGPFPETASKNLRRTPKEWLEELGDEFRYASQNKIDDVLYYIIEYDRPEGGVYRVWIESWKGWPYRIEVHKNGFHEGKYDARYVYEDFDVGGVSEDDVIPQ